MTSLSCCTPARPWFLGQPTVSPFEADAWLRQTGSGCESQGQAGAAEGLCAQLGRIGVYFQTPSDDKFQRSCNCYNLEFSGNRAARTLPLYVLIYPPGLPTEDSLNAAIEREQGGLLALKLSLIPLKAAYVSSGHRERGSVLPLQLRAALRRSSTGGHPRAVPRRGAEAELHSTASAPSWVMLALTPGWLLPWRPARAPTSLPCFSWCREDVCSQLRGRDRLSGRRAGQARCYPSPRPARWQAQE